MVLVSLLGFPIGASTGVLIGSFLASRISKQRTHQYLKKCDQEADKNPDVPHPNTAGKPVSYFKKLLLKDTTPSLTHPNYERALFINKILTLLWPHLSPAIHKEVMKQAKVPINDAIAKIPILEEIRIDKLDLGSRPFRVDSFASFDSQEDEIIMEVPLFWGGDISLRITAVLVLGSRKIDLPIDVSDVQFKFLARLTIKPLIETLPCIGGVTLTLLEEPNVDFCFRLADSPDLLALPGVPQAVKMAVKIVTSKMLVCPNEYTVPLMPNFGLPSPPQGVLHVRVISGHDIKSSFLDVVDPFVCLDLSQGIGKKTSTINDNPNPEWNEDLDLVINDVENQKIKIKVMDDDLMKSDIVGGIVMPIALIGCVKNPRKSYKVRLPVFAPGEEETLPECDENDIRDALDAASKDDAISSAISAMPKRHTMIGRLIQKKKIKKITKKIQEEDDSSIVKSKENSDIDNAHESDSASVTSHKRRHTAGELRGSLTMEFTFIPVYTKDGEALDKEKSGGRELEKLPSIRNVLNASSLSGSSQIQKGILNVHLKKVLGLPSSCASFVILRLHDPHKMPNPDMEERTHVELNEKSPRFNFKTDFVGISADSVLILNVYSQPSLLSLKSIPFLGNSDAKFLGRVRIPLSSVVSSGHLNDIIPMEDAESGEVQVILDWTSIDLD